MKHLSAKILSVLMAFTVLIGTSHQRRRAVFSQ